MQPYDDSDVQKLLQGNPAPSFHTLPVHGRNIHYVTTGNADRPLVMFIHGTPGSWKAFAAYLDDDMLAAHAHLAAIDRLGFGKSGPGSLVTSLQKQAASLAPIIARESYTGQALLVGHSLGGSIAVRLAMDFPELVFALVLVAPSLDPALEKPRWYNRLAAAPLIHRLVPEKLALANREVMVLSAELRQMQPFWQRLRLPVTVIQGMQDRLVDPGNAAFAESMMGKQVEVMRIADAGHFVLWNRPEIIRQVVYQQVQTSSQASRARKARRHDNP